MINRTIQFLIVALAAPLLVHGFSVNPMSVEIDPDEPNSQRLYVLSNTDDKDVPIELSVARPVIDENGFETLEMDVGEDDFVILPQQMILPANARRSVKVIYVGDNPGTEETYRIIFRQLPVELEEDPDAADTTEPTVNMQIVLEYRTRVWITPKGLKENLSVKSFTQTEAVIAVNRQNEDGTETFAGDRELQPVLQLVVENTGDKHGYLVHPTVSLVTTSGQEQELSYRMVKPIMGQVVLGGSERVFNLPLDEALPPIEEISELRLTVGTL